MIETPDMAVTKYEIDIDFSNVIYGVPALRCCAWAFSSCDKWGSSLVAVCGLFIVVASVVAEHRL